MPTQAGGLSDTGNWPENVGIIGMEVYFPSTYVDQTELETFDNVSQGKYTIGLGQDKMGFCSDCEDVNSLCLTVVQRLLEKYGISPSEIGRLEVGTETLIDKSKSVKTVLMQLFEESGNTDIEGVDTINACYGGTSALFNAVNWVESSSWDGEYRNLLWGTSALFNAVNWVESSSWDGRYAIVVTGDIAVYATGNARCTGGAGAIAMLIGAHAPLVFDRGCRATHMQHVYDFYKPNMESEYPVVDGKLSIQCYLHALDKCSQSFILKLQTRKIISSSDLLNSADAFIFHSPFCKLVQKSVARLLLNDFLRDPQKYPTLENFRHTKLEESYFDKDLEKALMKASQSIYEKKTKPSLMLANQVGNMYTPSVFGGLVSFLINTPQDKLPGCRCVIFSYGSGMASSMYSLKIRQDPSSKPLLEKLLDNLSDVKSRLENRIKVPPQEFDEMMKLRETTHHKAPYKPAGSTDSLEPGTWYLTNIDDKHRRSYKRKPATMSQTKRLSEGQTHEEMNGHL